MDGQISFDAFGNTSDDIRRKIEDLPRREIRLRDGKLKGRYLKRRKRPWFENIEKALSNNEFVVLDTETTGFVPYRDRIIELAAIRYINGEPREGFETLVDPGISIPKGASDVNGITDSMVAGEPIIDQVLPEFDDFIGSSAVVGHNLDFDLRFLYNYGSRIEDIRHDYFDTMMSAQRLLRKRGRGGDYDVLNHKLGTLCDYFGIYVPESHRALMDAYATGEVFLKLIDLVR